MSDETIVAISSSAAQSARVVVRLSGSDAIALAQQVVCENRADESEDIEATDDCIAAMSLSIHGWENGAHRAGLRIRAMRVRAWVYTFRAPRSYTGEDVVEFHLPGNALLARLLIEDLIRLGARQAQAGEFTARAYFNGRLDLAEAEGVAVLVSASNESERRAARQLLGGELARRLNPVMDLLAETLALVEVGIDFSEEEVTFLATDQVRDRIGELTDAMQRLLRESSRFERLSHEPRIVLIGPPNAGKSTLLNALAGRERAVVSDVAGTTRDVLSAEVDLPSGRVVLMDVAGIGGGGTGVSPVRMGGGTGVPPVVLNETIKSSTGGSPVRIDGTLNQIESQMRRRAMEALEEADRVVLIHPPNASPIPLPRKPDLIVHSKADLQSVSAQDTGEPPVLQVDLKMDLHPLPAKDTGDPPVLQADLITDLQSIPVRQQGEERIDRADLTMDLQSDPAGDAGVISVSAVTGAGMDQLRQALDALAFGTTGQADALALNARHVTAIESAISALARAKESLEDGVELIALELREALDELGGILGVVTPDDLLGRIFSRFCIGK